ncbi:DUF4352 domain-containing protein [Halorussus salinisoli]|uniref:DUF4352 domain-containing protein n=1 Tax=Halorussus salinisoli TaxID=2558242 RepID=UPI0010C19A9C|nr:DUF4352 domain-containing protein [Halorussus salinisoli]
MIRSRGRRALLQSGVVAIAGLAGCVGGLRDGDDEPNETETTRRRPSETTTVDRNRSSTGTPPGEPSAVEFVPVGVQSSFFYLTTPDSMDVEAVEGTQFVFVEVYPQTDSPPPSDFSLVADGRHFWGTLAPGEVGGPNRLSELGPGYRADETGSGWVAFEVPNPLDAEEVELAYRGRSQRVDETILADLRAPPADFEVVSFDAPEQVVHDESFEVSLTVENVGESDGVFRASLNQAGAMYSPNRAEIRVPAGERRERAWTFGEYLPSGTGRARFHLRSADTDREAVIEVVEGATEP